MQACGLDASLGESYCSAATVRLPCVDVVNRRGRPVALVHVVNTCTNVVNAGEWFFSARDALGPGGIYALISSAEVLLQLIDVLGECCSWERERVEGCDHAILVMRKGLDSDIALQRRLTDMRAACMDWDSQGMEGVVQHGIPVDIQSAEG